MFKKIKPDTKIVLILSVPNLTMALPGQNPLSSESDHSLPWQRLSTYNIIVIENKVPKYQFMGRHSPSIKTPTSNKIPQNPVSLVMILGFSSRSFPLCFSFIAGIIAMQHMHACTTSINAIIPPRIEDAFPKPLPQNVSLMITKAV